MTIHLNVVGHSRGCLGQDFKSRIQQKFWKKFGFRFGSGVQFFKVIRMRSGSEVKNTSRGDVGPMKQ